MWIPCSIDRRSTFSSIDDNKESRLLHPKKWRKKKIENSTFDSKSKLDHLNHIQKRRENEMREITRCLCASRSWWASPSPTCQNPWRSHSLRTLTKTWSKTSSRPIELNAFTPQSIDQEWDGRGGPSHNLDFCGLCCFVCLVYAIVWGLVMLILIVWEASYFGQFEQNSLFTN